MGGTIGMIVHNRGANGRDDYVPMLRWTNIMPSMFSEPALISDRVAEWWPIFAQQWLDMKNDYEQHSSTGKYAFPMTTSYFPHASLTPEGYGLVVVDIPRKTILDLQGYCRLGQFPIHHLLAGSSYHSEDRAAMEKNFRALHKAGHITHLLATAGKGKRDGFTISEAVELSLGEMPVDRLIDVLRKVVPFTATPMTPLALCKQLGQPLPEPWADFVRNEIVDVSVPLKGLWTFRSFDESVEGFVAFKQQLDTWNYPFTPADNAAWRSRMLEQLENDAPDDPAAERALRDRIDSVTASPAPRAPGRTASSRP